MSRLLLIRTGWRPSVISVALAWALGLVARAGDLVPSENLKALSVETLVERLDSAPRDRYDTDREGRPSYDALLCEIVRRAGEKGKDLLARRLEALDARLEAAREEAQRLDPESDTFDRQSRVVESLEHNLELIAALRRTQGKPDPLAVIIDRPDEIQAATREPPTLKVSLQNVDVEGRAFGFKNGGDNRSGRHARWRIHVWDSKGHLLPELPRPSFIGGGIYQLGTLAAGETWDAELQLSSYVKISTAGKYKVQILYHNSKTIADMDDPQGLDRLIVFRSEPFELNVEHGPMIEIRLDRHAAKEAQDVLSTLNENDPLRIVIGEYDEKASEFIDPETPQGRLLALAWQAVPALLEELQNKKLSFRRRAWVLSLLFSITRESDLNPMQGKHEFWPSGILPDYETRGTIVTSVTSKAGGSYSWHPEGKKSSGRADPAEQQALAERWLRFRDEYLDIRIED